jgi:hypothetical protein
MLDSTAARGQQDAIAVKDVAELLLESVEKKLGKVASAAPVNLPMSQPPATVAVAEKAPEPVATPATKAAEPASPQVERKKWQPKAAAAKEEQPKPAEEKLPDA